MLSDAEWAQVVADLMDRTGIAPRGDVRVCAVDRGLARIHRPAWVDGRVRCGSSQVDG